MNSKRQEAIFEAALALNAKQRPAYLDQACEHDPQLRQEVERLLQAHEQAGAFMAEPAAPRSGSTLRITVPLTEKPGDRIGPYKLLQQIGEGGCGVVYMAEQLEPIRRKVALKVIKLGMDTKAVIARFEAERQALALMDHPNIARVLDAGATNTGRPYFVMELVRGVRITDYCDQNHLSTRERLNLFIQVCHAIQHAHQKGIIHRDIKPSNILVTVNDGVPVPKVIDFGIAKATGGQVLTDKTLFTAFEQFIGTPAYMSPEQAAMTSLDIDTRSDIYALGVLFYELLTGQPPFDAKTLLSAGLDGMRRIIREQEPPRPSALLSSLDDGEQTTVAKRRQTEPPKLVHQVRGDLDWIVMKCLEKDRTRRYGTANGLAVDVENHLANRPVSAAAPTWPYRLSKFVRRNRVATAFMLLLLAGTTVSVWLAVRANQARRLAQHREAEARENLFASYLTTARASRLTGRPGRRFAALEAVAKAAAIRPSIELRSEAASALALVDVRVAREWQGFPPDSERIVIDTRFERYVRGDLQRNISLRRVQDDHEVRSWPARTAPERFSPDGRFLAGMCWGSRPLLQVWNLETGLLVLEEPLYLTGPTPDFHPSRPVIAAGVADGLVRFIDLETGRRWSTRSTNSTPAYLRFRPDGRQLAVAGRQPSNVQVYDTESGEPAAVLPHGNDLNRLDWSPDGRWLAAPCSDGSVYVWEMSQNGGAPARKLAGHDRLVFSVCFDPRGELLVSQSWDQTTAFWSWPSGELILKWRGTDTRLMFSRDGRWVGPDVDGSKVRLLEVARAPACRILSATPNRLGCGGAFSPDGRWLVVPGGDGPECWDARNWKRAWIERVDGAHFVAFHPDGRWLRVSGDTGLYEWPWVGEAIPPWLGPRHQLTPIRTGEIEFTRDGGVMVSPQSDGLRVHSALGSDPTLLPMPMCNFASVTPDGKWAAACPWAGHDSDLVVWELSSGREAVRLKQTLAAVQFTRDGRWLVSLTGTRLECRAVGTWQTVSQLPLERSPPGLALSPDSRWCAAHQGIQRILISELPQFRPVVTLDTGMERPVCFSPDNALLLTHRSDGQFCVWNLRLMREELATMGLQW